MVDELNRGGTAVARSAQKDGARTIRIDLNRGHVLVSRALHRADSLTIRFFAGLSLVEFCGYWERSRDGKATHKALLELCGCRPEQRLFGSGLASQLAASPALQTIDKLPIFGLGNESGPFPLFALDAKLRTPSDVAGWSSEPGRVPAHVSGAGASPPSAKGRKHLMDTPPLTNGSLKHDLSVLERERDSIIAAIHELRQRARQKSLEAEATHQPLPAAEIKFWQNGIATHQAELMSVQQKIGAVNKQLKKARKDEPRPSRHSQTNNVSGNGQHNGFLNNSQTHSQRPDEDLFLSCFHTIARGSLDPRQFAALEDGARSLATDYQRMNTEKAV